MSNARPTNNLNMTQSIQNNNEIHSTSSFNQVLLRPFAVDPSVPTAPIYAILDIKNPSKKGVTYINCKAFTGLGHEQKNDADFIYPSAATVASSLNNVIGATQATQPETNSHQPSSLNVSKKSP